MKVVIVIPTYNEAENIGRLIEALYPQFLKRSQNDYHILVVEGNSPDGTAQLVREKIKKYPFVHLLMEEKKAGLGSAYIFGFKYAMENLSPDVLIEMDADFQHDPADVIRLTDEIENGADYVIGSRFTKGGSIPKEWTLDRKFLSIGGSLFSKIVLGVFSVNDFTSGFKASRVKGFVDRLDFSAVLSKGFAYKIDLLYKMHKLGAKFKEVPIKFGLRDRGVSKMESNNTLDSMKVVLGLRLHDSANFIKFCFVGGVGFVVDSGLFNLFRLTIFSTQIAPLFSGLTAMVVTFLLNNYWSFSERKLAGAKNKAKSFIVYALSSAVPIVVRSRLVAVAINMFGDTTLVSNAAFFVGIVLGLVWNYVVYSKFIWRHKS